MSTTAPAVAPQGIRRLASAEAGSRPTPASAAAVSETGHSGRPAAVAARSAGVVVERAYAQRRPVARLLPQTRDPAAGARRARAAMGTWRPPQTVATAPAAVARAAAPRGTPAVPVARSARAASRNSPATTTRAAAVGGSAAAARSTRARAPLPA